MNRIKLLAVALVLSLAGFVYAAGNTQETGNKACGMDKAACCANCCKGENSCCKSHRMGHPKQGAQSGQENKEKSSCANCECCKDGKSCCAADKAGKAQGCCTSKGGANCCASGAGGCGESCRTKEKAKSS